MCAPSTITHPPPDDFKVANDNDDSAPPETCSTQTVDPCTPDLAPAGTCVDANNGECRDMTKSHECSTTGKSDTGACVIVQAGDNPEGSMYCYYPYVAKGTPCGCVPTNPCEMQAVCSGSRYALLELSVALVASIRARPAHRVQ